MKIKDLVEALLKLDQDKTVIIGFSDFEQGNETKDVSGVYHITEENIKKQDYFRWDEDDNNEDVYIIE